MTNEEFICELKRRLFHNGRRYDEIQRNCESRKTKSLPLECKASYYSGKVSALQGVLDLMGVDYSND